MPPSARVPSRRDALLAGALLVPSLVQVLWLFPITTRPLGTLYAVLTVTPVAWRRTAPVAAAAALGTVALWSPSEGFLVLGYVVVIVVFASLGMYAAGWVPYVVLAWALLAGSVGTLTGPEEPVAGLLSYALAVIGSYVAGRIVAHHRDQNRRLEELAGQLRVEKAEASRAAAADERARIAQELHDVIGHEVTLISIQSEAAAAALAQAPERATAPVDAVRATAHRASVELRSILGLLGTPDGGSVRPDPEGLNALTERARRSGVDNTLTVTGDPWLAANVWFALIRVVQESLTNAGKHAPGAAVGIDLDWTPERVRLVVSNPYGGSGGEPGRGLRGMAERCRMLGGTFAANTTGDAFVVTAELPRPGEVA